MDRPATAAVSTPSAPVAVVTGAASGIGAALAEGDEDADWEIRFNVNLGIYY